VLHYEISEMEPANRSVKQQVADGVMRRICWYDGVRVKILGRGSSWTAHAKVKIGIWRPLELPPVFFTRLTDCLVRPDMRLR